LPTGSLFEIFAFVLNLIVFAAALRD